MLNAYIGLYPIVLIGDRCWTILGHNSSSSSSSTAIQVESLIAAIVIEERTGPPSASMLKTDNLELANSIDPELTWKTVTKGFRSAPRRPRKPSGSLNMGVNQDDNNTKMGESLISDSEKFGVAVLGQCVAEKIKDLPIKKRRFMFRSPSPPPQTPSPHCEESLSSEPWTSSPQPEDFDQTIESKCVSGQGCSTDSVPNQQMGTINDSVAVQLSQGIENVHGQLLEVTNRKLGCTEDFSDIALLPDATCNNGISNDAHTVKKGSVVDYFLKCEGNDSSIPDIPSEITTSSSELAILFLKESTHEDNSVAETRNFHDKRNSETGKRSSPMKDDRLHWDLNTVMDAWELPCDDLNLGSQRNGSEDIPDDSVRIKNPEKLDFYVGHRDPEHALLLLKYSTANTELSTQVISVEKPLGNYPCLRSDSISSSPLSEEKMNSSTADAIIQTREACCRTSAMQLGQAVSIKNVHLGKHDVFLHDPTFSNKLVCKIDSIQCKEVSREAFDLPDNRTSPTELVSTVTCQMSDVEYSAIKSGKSGPSDNSPEHENSTGLGPTFGEGHRIADADVEKKQGKEAPIGDATVRYSLSHVELKELMPESYKCFGKVALEYPIDDRNGSDVSHGHGVGVEKMIQIQAGCDSPFEDGELRGSIASFEENVVEGETECVDYVSDYRDGDELDLANPCMSEVDSGSFQNDNSGSMAEKVMHCGRANALKESSPSASLNKFSEPNYLPEGCECSTNWTSETCNVSTQKCLAVDSVHELDVEGSSMGEVGLGKLLPSCPDTLPRKDNLYMQLDRPSYDLCFQKGRVFGSEKYMERDRRALPMQGQNQQDGHWVDSPEGCWDSRNHYQTGYPPGTGHRRGKGVIANSAPKIDGLAYRHQKRFMDNSSKGVYQPRVRRRSPAVSDDTYGYSAPRRMVAADDNSHTRIRGRSRIYRPGFSRGHRDYHHGPMSDNASSSSVMVPHYLSGREHHFSPMLNRGASFSQHHRKFRSRSRTRSPISWHLERERNMEVRCLSRSPDFRPEAKMGRVRVPFQKSNYPADDDDGIFMSPPRTCISPQYHSRWTDDRNCVATRFRGRKPPGRLFGWSQECDSGDSHRRMRSDDCFRSNTRPGRSIELSGGAGRGHNGSTCERTNYRDKYEKNQGVMRCDTSGVIRRIRYDVEDYFEVHNTHNEDGYTKGTDRSDLSRGGREERGPPRYSNERMYAYGPKLSGIRDYGEDVSPSRR
ncbi:hypothetical protein U1Q18_004622 [Sarracenia purpurea var. burkii]